MNSMEDFDKRVERFLKKQLTHDEELAFVEELKADKALLERAKTLALAIDEMGILRSQRDAAIIKGIASLDEKAYQTAIWSNDQMSHFDELTNRFQEKSLWHLQNIKNERALHKIQKVGNDVATVLISAFCSALHSNNSSAAKVMRICE